MKPISSVRIEDTILTIQFMDAHKEDHTFNSFLQAREYMKSEFVGKYNITQIFRTST